MPSVITYIQLLFLTNTSLTCQTVQKSFTEKGKLILILENSQKISIAGKNIDTSGYKKRFVNWYRCQKKSDLIFQRSQLSIMRKVKIRNGCC